MGTQIRYAILVAGVVLIAALIYIDLPESVSSTNTPDTASSTIQLKDHTITVTIADTAEERERGLGGLKGLQQNEGMLFVFPGDGRYAFWMKDMRFAIDILWISREGVVVDIEKNVSPETFPASFEPRTEARYVLELSAGASAELNVKIGDVVRL